MKKIWKTGIVWLSVLAMLAGCGKSSVEETAVEITAEELLESAEKIELSDDKVTLNGDKVTSDDTAAVYVANDIVHYETGKDFTYGEGTEEDAHTAEEAAAHTVVHITEPGVYALSGKLSSGQIAIDLGEEAEDDPDAVVTLLLNGIDISCTVAPAVIFYNVYECGSADEEEATKDVDTSDAGANVYIMDNKENIVNGSYVARIYESYELNDDGTEVVDSKKLHKYDGAFYSKMSMNVNGGSEGTGVLNINAENEGLDSELHLTINGGNINIVSGNDGINTNEDGVSVTTINGGKLDILVDGSTGEGDGIDSNGWLVINGGIVTAEACSFSGDAGIDSDMGIHINGGTVAATGNMLDRISESEQNYAVFQFASSQKAGASYSLKNEKEEVVAECAPENDFMYLIFSSDGLTEGTYTLWADDTQLEGVSGNMMGGGRGGQMPEDGEMPEDFEMPEDGEMPEGMEKPEDGEMPEGMEKPEGREMPEGMEKPEDGEMPEGMEIPENGEMPEGMEIPEDGEMPEGMERPQGGQMGTGEASVEFTIVEGGNYFTNVGAPGTTSSDEVPAEETSEETTGETA